MAWTRGFRGEQTMKNTLVLCAATLWAAAAWGQAGSSTITGRVIDVTGSTVPNVSVSAVQTSTNFTFTAVTNNAGIYRIPSLHPGPYPTTYQPPASNKLTLPHFQPP